MRAKCQKIIDHKINVFINRQLIYNFPEQIFAEAGIMSIEHADFDGVEMLAAVTGGEVASTFDHPELVNLGKCDLIEEIMIGEDKVCDVRNIPIFSYNHLTFFIAQVIKFSGCQSGEACTIVLRGASNHMLDEAERR
tara:strand:- start:655 stop:1065 length:411 start_codon:yes stop_codon:yes gene_type:complete